MATLREIRRRIAGVKETQKITRAMKMVAAARLRRAQEDILAARPYARKMLDLLRHLVTKVDPSLSPLLATRDLNNVVLMVVTGDRGLCGAFNSNIIRYTTSLLETTYREMFKSGHLKLICIGKKGYDFFSKRNYSIIYRQTGFFDELSFSDAQSVVTELVKGYLDGVFDKVEVVYNEFKSAMQQRVVREQFLPIPPEEVRLEKSKPLSQIDYIYEPSAKELIGALVPKHLNVQMWRILLESNAAEQGARMSAMDNATENARELIESLQLSLNKARQAAITKELLEVVSGANALKESSVQ
jgi:F-type H+-transporting ATPase subunit gamma